MDHHVFHQFDRQINANDVNEHLKNCKELIAKNIASARRLSLAYWIIMFKFK